MSREPTEPSAPPCSVLMPVHNAAATVVTAIESIRQQSLPHWELLAVNDHSTDQTPALLQNLARQDGRIRVLQSPARGIVAALNHGLEHARGAVIARMDADDVAHPNRLATQLAYLDQHPSIAFLGSRVHYGGDAKANAGYAHYVDWLNRLVQPADIEQNRFVESPLAHPSVTFRREAIDCGGPYRDGDFPEDYELWLRWMDAGLRPGKCPETLLTWNDPPGRLSRTDPRYRTEAFYQTKARYLAQWLQNNVAPEREIWVWGAGRRTRSRLKALVEHGITFHAFLDIDPRKIGQQINGRPVYAPDQLPPPGRVFVLPLVAARGARDLIAQDLAQRHYRCAHDFILAA